MSFLPHMGWEGALLILCGWFVVSALCVTTIGKLLAGPPEVLPPPHHTAIRKGPEAPGEFE